MSPRHPPAPHPFGNVLAGFALLIMVVVWLLTVFP